MLTEKNKNKRRTPRYSENNIKTTLNHKNRDKTKTYGKYYSLSLAGLKMFKNPGHFLTNTICGFREQPFK